MNPFLTKNPPKTVQELFADTSRWTKGQDRWGARNNVNALVPMDCDAACCFCLGAAIGMVYRSVPDHSYEALRRVEKVLAQEYSFHGLIPVWNDAPTTTIEMVREVARLADI